MKSSLVLIRAAAQPCYRPWEDVELQMRVRLKQLRPYVLAFF